MQADTYLFTFFHNVIVLLFQERGEDIKRAAKAHRAVEVSSF